MILRCGLVALVVCSLALDAAAFKMGLGGEFDAAKQEAASSASHWTWTYSRVTSDSVRFGDPVHEEMTVESVRMVQRRPEELHCKPSTQAVQRFVAKPERPTVSSHLCCSPSAKSAVCELLGDKRYSRFTQEAPLIDGVRWNDDPCHMTLWSDRTRSKAGWLVWMVGAGYMRFNNFNYASHFHEMQFLHAMAPSSRGDPTSYREPRSMTRRKVLAWAEFAYLVAEGSIAPAMTMQEVHARLSKVARKPFELGFGLSNRRSVGFLFTGELDPDPLQVRQIAVGALLHTIQDSFSSSHVERVRSPRDGEGRQLVGDKGAIRRFLTYRGQDAVEHGVADRRPGDWDRANPGDLHPVSIGAQVVACAASTEGASPDLS